MDVYKENGMRFKTKFTPLGGITSKYKKGEVIFESSVARTYDFESVGCTCEISVIGAGGGAAGTQSSNACAASAGASGSGFIGIVKLPKGHIYLTIGAGGASQCWLDGNCYGSAGGNSIIKILEQPIISCAGGGGGHTWWRSGASPAALGAMPVIGIDVVGTPILNRQGNTGTNYNSGPGGASIITGTMYGKGGDTTGWSNGVQAFPGKDGYIKIKFIK